MVCGLRCVVCLLFIALSWQVCLLFVRSRCYLFVACRSLCVFVFHVLLGRVMCVLLGVVLLRVCLWRLVCCLFVVCGLWLMLCGLLL